MNFEKYQVIELICNLMNKKKLINLLQAINFGDMIPLVNTAVVERVGADEFDPTVALNPPLHIGKNMQRIVGDGASPRKDEELWQRSLILGTTGIR